MNKLLRYFVNIALPFLALITFLSGQLVDIKQFNGEGNLFPLLRFSGELTYSGPLIEKLIYNIPLTFQSARVLLRVFMRLL